MATETDRIEKTIVLRASQERVWKALTDAREFGAWFGMKVEGAFVAGQTVQGTIAATTVDPVVAAQQKPHEGLRFNLAIDRIEPQSLFSFRWHPHAVDAAADYTSEPMTEVAFRLEKVADGVRLTVTESGFDRIPLERRAKAFASNSEGWAIQTKLIEAYLAKAQ